MSARQEARFTCNRCGAERNVPLANNPSAGTLLQPAGWTVYWWDNRDVPLHLCAECTAQFDVFMRPEAANAESAGGPAQEDRSGQSEALEIVKLRHSNVPAAEAG